MNDKERCFLSQLFLDNLSLMYAVARRFFEKDNVFLDDAVGSAVEKICRYCPSVMRIPDDKLKAYIVTVVENACKDIAREQARFVSPAAGNGQQSFWELIPDLRDCFGYIYASSDLQNIRTAFDSLAEKEKDLFTSYFLDKVPLDILADEMNATVGAVKTSLSRVKARFLAVYREIREIS